MDDITALNLQRAIQAAIDLATHIAAAEGYGTPDSMGAAFTLLERHGLIDLEQTVNPEIMERIVERHLGDLRAFATRVLERFEIQEPGS